MFDKETAITTEEEKLLEESYVGEQKGRLVSSKDLRKEISSK